MDLKIAESLYLNLELFISDLNSVSSTMQFFSCNGCGCVRMDTSDTRGEGLGDGMGDGLGNGNGADVGAGDAVGRSSSSSSSVGEVEASIPVMF